MQIGLPQEPAERQTSFRTKVRRALGLVLLITLPLLLLTLYYLDRIRGTADAVASQVALLHEVELIRNAFMRLTVPPPNGLGQAEHLQMERDLGQISDRANAVLEAYPSHVIQLKEVASAAGRMTEALNDWQQVLDRPSGPPGGPASPDVVRSHARVDEARLALDDRLFAIVVAVLDELRVENVAAERAVAHADRNMVTLVLLAVVVMILMLLVLPNALVQPITRLTRAVRSAATGRASVRIEAPANDEIGELASVFNETMDTLRQFDSLKRDRIMEDSGKIDTLLRHAGGPAAILTPQFTVETANREFLQFFGAIAAEGEVPIPELLKRGRADLEQLLTRAREHRHEILDHTIQLGTGDERARRFRATVDVCRDRRTRPTHLLLVLVGEIHAPTLAQG